MKNSKFVVLMATTIFSLSACSSSTTSDCSTCGVTKVSDSAQPDKKSAIELSKVLKGPLEFASKSSLVIAKSEGRTPAGDVVKTDATPVSQSDYQFRFCLEFAQIEGNLVGFTIKEMEATPYLVDEFFKTPACQPEGYSNVVKSPIAHIIADDPSKRVGFLDSIWLYYSKKRKDPAKFVEMVNAKNTEGETLLDYFETRKKEPIYARLAKEDIDKIVAVACSHGAVYSVYKDKKCP
jgi:hypothetical protein